MATVEFDQKLIVAHAKLPLGQNFVPEQPMPEWLQSQRKQWRWGGGSQIHSTNVFFDFQNLCRRLPMRLAVHLWNMARIRKQMKKSIKSSSAKSPETQGHSLPEGLTEGSMKAGGLEPAKTGLRDRISPICTLSQNGYGRI